jgi:hypothetical protein
MTDPLRLSFNDAIGTAGEVRRPRNQAGWGDVLPRFAAACASRAVGRSGAKPIPDRVVFDYFFFLFGRLTKEMDESRRAGKFAGHPCRDTGYA